MRRGLRTLTWEGIASTGFSSITTSGFLVAFALALGADNFHIGLLASIPFITDLLQIPAVWLVEKFRRRKIIVLVRWLLSQLLWLPIALIPLIMNIPNSGAISMLLGLMAARGMLNALTNCAWSSWLRDLVPQKILGRYFAKRLSLTTAVAVALGLGAAFFLDHWGQVDGGAIGYTWVLLIGLASFGLASVAFTAFIPEPMMPPKATLGPSFVQTVTTPLREHNYRQLMKFLLFWGFASNLAIPFFTVFMYQQLKLPVFTVIALTTIGELFTVISLRFWGPLADKLGSKPVLSFSTSLFLLVFLGWTLTTVLGQHALVMPLLVILYIIDGIAAAGIILTVDTLSLKLAPQGRATPHLAGASLADSVGASLGALAGGLIADYLSRHTLTLNLSIHSVNASALQLTGFPLLFGLAFIVGSITLSTLHGVREAGAPTRKATFAALMTETRAAFRPATTVPDLHFLSLPPLSEASPLPRANAATGVSTGQPADAIRTPVLIITRRIHRLSKKPPSQGVVRV